MRKLLVLGMVLIIGAVSYNLYSTMNIKYKPELTAENIPNTFEKYELYLKPQIQDENYPIINEVKPQAYELLDGGVYIYNFIDKEELNQGIKEYPEVFQHKVYVYPINNILIVYWPGKDDPAELTKEINAKIQKIIEK